MKILILGGTQFIGRHLVQSTLAGGHEVTLFNRGKTGPELFPTTEKLIGNRDNDLNALRGRVWDAVLDVTGYLPAQVNASVQMLANAVDRYVFISTVMVLADFRIAGQDETAPLALTPDPPPKNGTGDVYGWRKAHCEKAVEAGFTGRALVIRPGFVVGPHDHTDRFTSWVRRIRRGGEMLAPGGPEGPLQFIDVRDLAAFVLHALESGQATAYNVTGPLGSLTWGSFFSRSNFCLGAETDLTWVSDEFLLANGLSQWKLPLYPPPTARGLMAIDARKAIAAGLTFRSLEQTIADTLQWHDSFGTATAGLPPDRETALLKAWHAR